MPFKKLILIVLVSFFAGIITVCWYFRSSSDNAIKRLEETEKKLEMATQSARKARRQSDSIQSILVKESAYLHTLQNRLQLLEWKKNAREAHSRKEIDRYNYQIDSLLKEME